MSIYGNDDFNPPGMVLVSTSAVTRTIGSNFTPCTYGLVYGVYRIRLTPPAVTVTVAVSGGGAASARLTKDGTEVDYIETQNTSSGAAVVGVNFTYNNPDVKKLVGWFKPGEVAQLVQVSATAAYVSGTEYQFSTE